MTDTQHPPNRQSIPVQQPLPLAFVNGEVVIEKPEDLYIPPDALEVILEAFEGPLDLLLYLIRKQKFDIATLPLLNITRQYMEYVEVMKEFKLTLAAEYLVMAAMLAEIKSRVLLPRREATDDEEDDPRAELIRRLQEYELIKRAAQELDGIPRFERDVFLAQAEASSSCQSLKTQPEVSLQELVWSFQQVMQRVAAFESHQVQKETLSTRERMSQILAALDETEFMPFNDLFSSEEGKAGVVVTFLAILELTKEKLIQLVQAQPYSHIHVRVDRQHVVDVVNI